MAYPINVGAVAEFTVEGRLQNQQVMNVFHYVLEGDPVTPIADGRAAMVTALEQLEANNDLLDLYTKAVSQDYEEIYLYGQWITPTRYAYVQGFSGPTSGTIATPSLPANVAGTIVRRGDLANRNNISTTHIPGVPNDATLGGEITPAQRNLYNDLLTVMLRTIAVGGAKTLVPCAFNRQSPAGSAKLTEGYINTTARVMRRRTVGVGS